MFDKVIKVYKNKGETPLDCIKNLKKYSENTPLPMTYAGRLDPLAEGLLLILTGDECLHKDKYLKLSKEYEVDVLFGFSTDTSDIMGKLIKSDKLEYKKENDKHQVVLNNNFDSILKNFTGKIVQKYPAYSSRTVEGKPLFIWAREGKLESIEIPSHEVFIKDIKIINKDKITGNELLEKIKKDISLVKGDFRQEEIIDLWEQELENKIEVEYQIVRLKVFCGSGVYVRVLAKDIGEKLNIPSLALNIKRTKIGEYTVD
jgi:tRNA pseudouridine55 synthase